MKYYNSYNDEIAEYFKKKEKSDITILLCKLVYKRFQKTHMVIARQNVLYSLYK